MTGAATLLMMPDGETPAAADFAAGDRFATYEGAIRAAHERAGPHQPMAPWIEIGGRILDPSHVMATNTPPARVETTGDDADDPLDGDLEATFPASDPPARTAP